MKIKQSLITCSLLVAGLVNVADAKTTYIPKGYSIETITTPKDVRFHATGLDTNKQGHVYVATRFGDVWALKNDTWTKFADGLHEPTGLMCDDDGSIVVGQKPELTRLVDLDKDGVADDYIRVADGWEFHDNYHEFNFAPVKDKAGNYYGTLNLGHGVPDALKLGAMDSGGGYRGWAYKVSPDGKFTPFASGLRSPAGLGMSPNNEMFYTDNQGDWVETSKLHLLEEGKFYGHPVTLRDDPNFGLDKVRENKSNFKMFDEMREKPVVWIPHLEVANSPGNPEWDVSKGKFGPFEGQIFIGDQTQSNIFRVMLDKVKGKYQGAVINFIDGFQSGNIRLDFDNQGQLWVGQTARGWGAKGGKPFGLQKVVWNGETPFELLDMKLTAKGFKLSFTQALSDKNVLAKHFKVHEYNYKYTSRYGSDKHNTKDLTVKNVTLSEDKKSAEIELDLTADKVVVVDFSSLRNVSKEKPSVTKVYYTLNQLL
ncbi:DUF7133 domain-containing protein [Paraglaciecola sp.]|uniref:DUF7133 domain-containing protein n=1 Tax=Paraglaciecola sp. TaxID=1920173 RepID=UPI003EF2AE7E